MRRAVLLATLLARASSGVAVAQPSVASVSSGYHYFMWDVPWFLFRQYTMDGCNVVVRSGR
jgi:hypothetical protein